MPLKSYNCVVLTPQTLLFDADDTLWENNIYFERAIASFISYLDHRVHSPAEVRQRLNACEHATIAQHGYGLASFRKSLIACFEQLCEEPLTPELRAQRHSRIVAFTDAIATTGVELMPAVEPTLRTLAARHRLILVTKGDTVEQTDKLARSGLQPLFAAVEVLAEKNAAAYRTLIARHRLDPQTTWMIGNSPRSDINPSLAAGLHAVFVPHDHTWVMEHETLDTPPPHQHLLQLDTFAALLEHF
jgi:putative hydrolase of the HAD superfamily